MSVEDHSAPPPAPPPTAAAMAGLVCGMKKELTAQQKVTAEWDAMAGEWDDLARGYAQAFYRMLVANTEHLMPELSSSSSSSPLIVVDFGCGTGLLTEKLQHQADKILALDASPKMIQLLQDKILCRGWTNVTTHAVVLANILNDDSIHNTSNVDNNESSSLISIKDELDSLQGKVGLVVASSVLTFIPPPDLEPTMRLLGKLLKPGTGLLVHSDWPKSETNHPDAMSKEKALQIYAMAADSTTNSSSTSSSGLQVISMGIEPFHMGDRQGSVEVFVGVARKPAAS